MPANSAGEKTNVRSEARAGMAPRRHAQTSAIRENIDAGRSKTRTSGDRGIGMLVGLQPFGFSTRDRSPSKRLPEVAQKRILQSRDIVRGRAEGEHFRAMASPCGPA